ncbi:DUF4407 domain-containing protein [Flaviaesturariibacter aridisoli]|uniref:DUF4407 domain-containing protein n=1 Tax=Flaviaesturariibacter aridisoli TaxID=2545761 RepID=A0A4R4E5S4_9BACT|nr:DUF4407 domain-containing protein [Flaviaesturariibacter aridisoli]TCZ74100.1 DUF4407 domain-containing protein [Flaviaesturariibacter aridisoli]
MAENNNTKEPAYTYDSFEGRSAGSNSNFLWWCAGAHAPLLRQYPSEGIKYSGLGGVLLATFVLAALSSGYALYSIFGHLGYAVAFALVWGVIIFNFDRFLVSTMRKYGVSKRRQLLLALPRIALALLIGVTIARPLELKIFEKEINVKMVENTHRKIQRNDSLLQLETKTQIAAAEAERARITARRATIEDSLARLQSAYVQEADGTGGSGRRGIEQLTRLKMGAWQAAQAQYAPEQAQLAAALRTQDSTIAAARAALEEKRRGYEGTAGANLGFLERNKALSDLADEEPSVWWSTLLVSLLIILLETGPILSKLIMPVGPYDIALAREELLQMAASENDLFKGRDLLFDKKKKFYERQREVSGELVDKLTELQKKHIDDELDKWERGEWSPKDHRASMDEVLRKIRKDYGVEDDSLL